MKIIRYHYSEFREYIMSTPTHTLPQLSNLLSYKAGDKLQRVCRHLKKY